jgi:hypothetical protein
MIKPIFENEADEQVKYDYQRIKQSLDTHSLPLFFAYLGVYPEYLRYITEQLVTNLRDPQFGHMSREIQSQLTNLVCSGLPKKTLTSQLLQTHYQTPEFHHFESQISTIIYTNVKLALLFVALREAVKGWAVAAKQLKTENTAKVTASQIVHVEDFVYQPEFNPESSLVHSRSSHLHTNPQGITISLLPEYLRLCRTEFDQYMHEDLFWIIRLEIEKILLNYLRVFPHIIFSPINVVLELSKKYPHFPDLIYLLSEHFPTYAVQRMMFSMYMKP